MKRKIITMLTCCKIMRYNLKNMCTCTFRCDWFILSHCGKSNTGLIYFCIKERQSAVNSIKSNVTRIDQDVYIPMIVLQSSYRTLYSFYYLFIYLFIYLQQEKLYFAFSWPIIAKSKNNFIVYEIGKKYRNFGKKIPQLCVWKSY